MFMLAIRHNVAAKQQLVMSVAAARKVDELSAAAAAGALSPSPPDALDRGAEGFADVIVEAGVFCVRRWLVAPLSGHGRAAIAIVVRVSVAGAGDLQVVTIREAPGS